MRMSSLRPEWTATISGDSPRWTKFRGAWQNLKKVDEYVLMTKDSDLMDELVHVPTPSRLLGMALAEFSALTSQKVTYTAESGKISNISIWTCPGTSWSQVLYNVGFDPAESANIVRASIAYGAKYTKWFNFLRLISEHYTRQILKEFSFFIPRAKAAG